ncbi:MAG TPA: NAD(P)-dependent oxidoreductase [Candidatus Dormibacteraeota bacterium]
MSETVGVIGLGAMGGPMAANLVRAGFEVAGYDVDPGRAQQPGVHACTSVSELCGRAAVVVSIVRTLPQTEEVVAEVETAARPRSVLVVMSTISPSAMSAIAERLRGRQVEVLDAPVSGGVAGAEAGTLAIMAGGSPAVLDRVRPFLDVFGPNLFHVGERPGDAQAVKLANQMMLAVNMLGVHEALRLAASYGMPPERVLPVVAKGTGASWVGENWETVRGWWEGHPSGGALDIIYKDLRTILGDAAERQLSYPVAALAFNLLREVW